MNHVMDSQVSVLDHPDQRGGCLDMEMIRAVDALSQEELGCYGGSIPRNLKHYLEHQVCWLQDSIYFLGIDLGHRPTPAEIADKILNSSHSERYRAYYAMRFPDMVSMS